MRKNDISPLPTFFDRYILLTPDLPMLEALEVYSPETVFDKKQLETIGNRIYAPEKWTVKTILQHCIDTERIMSYRALRFARNDATALPGFDEELFGATCEADARSIDELMNEFTSVRQSTLHLFRSFNDTMLQRKGATFKGDIAVAHLGFMMVGHAMHHQKVIVERYAPLI